MIYLWGMQICIKKSVHLQIDIKIFDMDEFKTIFKKNLILKNRDLSLKTSELSRSKLNCERFFN